MTTDDLNSSDDTLLILVYHTAAAITRIPAKIYKKFRTTLSWCGIVVLTSSYQAHDAERAAVASAGRARYHELFNGARVLKFMVETMLGESYSEPYEWKEEVYR